jgi:ABC-type multidrug transport system ATPase subunit
VSEFVTELHGVSKAFRFFELRDVTLRLAPGQILGLVGPNGAGKSTTMRILMAFVEQDRGEVKVLGHAMPRQQAAAKREVGFVSEEMGLYGPAVRVCSTDMTKDAARAYVQRWIEAGRLLEAQRWDELSKLDPQRAIEASDMLIAAALRVPLPSARRKWSGLVDQQRSFHHRLA